MSFAPVAPTHRVAPEKIAPDTWLIHSVAQALGEEPLFVYLNSMVITGAEPVIVDVGTICNRTQWLDDVFGIVDPADVRWVFVSHDDVDHIGNLEQVMEACPDATVVASWAITERHANALNFPLPQCRWLNDGEAFDAGDRRLRAVRPPVYDSPTTRGLFDESTGVYWAVDCVRGADARCAVRHDVRPRYGLRRRGRADVLLLRVVAVAQHRRPDEVRGHVRCGAGARDDDDRERARTVDHRGIDRQGVPDHTRPAQRHAGAVSRPSRARHDSCRGGELESSGARTHAATVIGVKTVTAGDFRHGADGRQTSVEPDARFAVTLTA